MSQNDKRRYYWLRLHRDFFKRHDIRIIEAMENGKDYLLFYMKLLVEAIDHEGGLRFSDTVPYNDTMLATITNTNVDIVRTAVKVFSDLGMMERLDNGTLFMTQTAQMVGSDTSSRQRVAEFRAKRKEIERHIPAIETHANNSRYGGFYYKAFERDGGACAMCGATNPLCMHHIIMYDPEDVQTVRLENLVTLCRTCHAGLHKNDRQAAMPPDEILNSINFGLLHGNGDVTQEIEIELEIEEEGPQTALPFNQTRYKRLCKAYGKDAVDDYLQRVAAWAANKNKRVKDAAGYAENWMKRDGVASLPGTGVKKNMLLHPPTCSCGGKVKTADGEALCLDCGHEWKLTGGKWEMVE